MKQFKGCVKIPLDTSVSDETLLVSSSWFGDWKNKRRRILSKKRAYTINQYIYNSLGNVEVINIYSPNKLDYIELKELLRIVIDDIRLNYPTLDTTKSYITISC